jgi:hypothetical protein
MMAKGDRFGDYVADFRGQEVRTFFDGNRQQWRLLRNSRETFYNAQNQMREWPTEQQAIDWLRAHALEQLT